MWSCIATKRHICIWRRVNYRYVIEEACSRLSKGKKAARISAGWRTADRTRIERRSTILGGILLIAWNASDPEPVSAEIVPVFCPRRSIIRGCVLFTYCIPDKRCRAGEQAEQKLVKRSLKARDTREPVDRERKGRGGRVLRTESERLRLIKARTRHSGSIRHRDWLLLVRWLSLPRLLTTDA